MKAIQTILATALLAAGLGTYAVAPAFAQDAEKAEENGENGKNGKNGDKKKKEKTLAETVKNFEKSEGLFTAYRNPKTGSLMLEVTNDQIGKDFIYYAFVEDGPSVVGLFRGRQAAQSVLRLNKYFDRIEFVEQNTRFYFDPASPMAKGAQSNAPEAVLASAKIMASSKDGARHLIKMDGALLSESLVRLSPNGNPKKKPHEQFALGKLSKGKNKITNVGNYPENLNVTVQLVYENPKPFMPGGEGVTDARSIAVGLQHAFIAAPENGYEPRIDDARIGYFTSRQTDMVSADAAPYRDLITRWDLVKKDADAALSEPVTPITWWIENTTPLEYREAIRDGVLSWNSSFEKAGFKNAVVVKIQPDDATWDAGDVRYNVLRWMASPTPSFGGYGPSYADPRSGQILGADVALEHVFVTNRIRYTEIFEGSSSAANELTAFDPTGKNGIFCSLGHELQASMVFGKATLEVMDADPAELGKLVQQGIYYLALHEVGHTLGLNHNMKSSQLHSNADIHDDSITQGILAGSVMDYPAINVAPPGVAQGDYYNARPGPYDDWAIGFGYDPEINGAAREAWLARSTEPALAFGNDADDMRAPGKAIDPRVNIGDMTSDALDYAADRFRLTDELLGEITAKFTKPGESYAGLVNALTVSIRSKQGQASVVSRYIGGVHVDRAVGGQSGGGDPFTPVSVAEQKKAMAILRDNVFAPDAFNIPANLLRHAARQRRGFDHFQKTDDPKAHQAVLAIHKSVLAHLLHPVVMARISDSTLYGNSYDLATVTADLSDAIFAADLTGSVNGYRQNLQVQYVGNLAAIIGAKSKHDHRAKAAAFAQLKRIEDWMKKNRRGDAGTTAHRAYVAHLVEKALDPKG